MMGIVGNSSSHNVYTNLLDNGEPVIFDFFMRVLIVTICREDLLCMNPAGWI